MQRSSRPLRRGVHQCDAAISPSLEIQLAYRRIPEQEAHRHQGGAVRNSRHAGQSMVPLLDDSSEEGQQHTHARANIAAPDTGRRGVQQAEGHARRCGGHQSYAMYTSSTGADNGGGHPRETGNEADQQRSTTKWADSHLSKG